MNHLDFPIVDAHIHQWDPYHTPHAAALAVKLFGKRPKLLDKVVRLVKSKELIDTIGLTQHITAPIYQKIIRKICDIMSLIKSFMLKLVGIIKKAKVWLKKRLSLNYSLFNNTI